MESKIVGTVMPVLELSMQPGDKVFAESGELSWMSMAIQMQTGTSVCIWIAIDIHDSSPDSANTLSPGCMLSSSTGITVPTIFDSMDASLASVVRVDHTAARGMGHRAARAIVADPDHEHLRPQGLESMAFLEVRLELVDELFLDVHDTAADLADRVMVIAARQLIVRRAIAQVRRVNGARRRQRFERPVHRAARKVGRGPVQLDGDLLGSAVAAQPHDRVVDHRPLGGAPHPGRQHQMTRSARSAFATDLVNAGDEHAVLAAGGLDRDLVADAVSDQGFADGRLEAHPARLGIGLRRPDDSVRLLLPLLADLGEPYGVAQADHAVGGGRLDQHVVLDDGLELLDPCLHHSLIVLGGVVLEVLGEVAELAGRLDLGHDRRSLLGGELFQLTANPFEPLRGYGDVFCHRHSFESNP